MRRWTGLALFVSTLWLCACGGPRSAVNTPTPTLARGDRVEAVLVQPENGHVEQRVRAVVDDDGSVDVPSVGRFSATGRSTRELEQDMLKTLNGADQMRGLVRVVLAPAARSGFFLTAPQATFDGIRNDPGQLKQLDRGEHPVWQWATVPEDLRHYALTTIERSGEVRALVRPAHRQLVADSLIENVRRAWLLDQAPPTVAVQLEPIGALAMENVTRRHIGRPLLMVVDDRVVQAPVIQSIIYDRVHFVGLDQPTRQRLLQLLGRE